MEQQHLTTTIKFPKDTLFLRRMRTDEQSNAPDGSYIAYTEEGKAVEGYENLNVARGLARLRQQHMQWMH